MARKVLVSSRKVVRPQDNAASENKSDTSGSNSVDEHQTSPDPETKPVLPETTPRGKQLRFPTNNDDDSSSSESYASIESSDEEMDVANSVHVPEPTPTAEAPAEAPAEARARTTETDDASSRKEEPSEEKAVVEPQEKTQESEKGVPSMPEQGKSDDTTQPKQHQVKREDTEKKDKTRKTEEVENGKQERKTTAKVKLEHYRMSEYVRNQMLLIASEKKVNYDKNESQQFRQDLALGKVKRVKMDDTSEKPTVESKFAKRLSTCLEAILTKDEPGEEPAGKKGTSGKQPKSDNGMDREDSSNKRSRTEESAPPQAKRPKSNDSGPPSSKKESSKKDYSSMDVHALRKKSDRLNEEARAMKHRGDRIDKSETKKRGEYYIKASLKFFEYATVLADIKQIYRVKGDDVRSKQFGEAAIRILPQTGSLIEVASRSFSTANNRRLLAVSYKFAAIVYMYIFRVQRTKLDAIYREMNNALKASKVSGPGSRRSPISPAAGEPISSPVPLESPPLTNSTGVSSVPVGVPHTTYDFYMKEMSFLFKAFDLWSRYERYDASVLPSLTDLATVDVNLAISEIDKLFD